MSPQQAKILISDISADPTSQPRSVTSLKTVSEYVERMTEGDTFPPMVVFYDGKTNWLADGFHRYHAAIGIGRTEFECDVREGGLRDAVLYSCGANAAHGVPRTNEDKRRAVMKLLQDAEWSHWSDREIARKCNVGHPLVAQIRSQSAPTHLEEIPDRPRTVERGGKTYTQNTGAIGKKPTSGNAPDAPAEPTPAWRDQHERDLANSWISTALREMQREFLRLPPPSETIKNYPHFHRHTLTFADLNAMANWMRTFAEEWMFEFGS
jgi:hypothetical protein